MEPLQPRFKEMLSATFGAREADALCKALDTEPEASVRLNPAKMSEWTADPAVKSRVKWCDATGRILESRPQYAQLPLWHSGSFYVQEPASMIMSAMARHATETLGVTSLRWLDLCAAPGGKTTAALAALSSDAIVTANEYDSRRASVLAENIAKWGAPNIVLTRGDTSWVRRLPEKFHVVAVDAPCSGEGMMRKEPIARSQWSEQLVDQCAQLQKEILGNAWEALMPGGLLIYSTCTFNRRENEDNLLWLIDNFGAENLPLPSEASASGAAPALDSRLKAARFMPHITESEGLFIALLRKPGNLPEVTPRITEPTSRKRRDKKHASNSDNINKTLLATATDRLASPDDFDVEADDNGNVYAIPRQHAEFIKELKRNCPSLISAGLKLATIKGRDLIPAPELALSTALAVDSFPRVDLTEEEALDYLRRGTSGAATAVNRLPNPQRGYMIVTHCGIALGFIKNLGNRINNLYPAAWRLRMS